MVENLISEVARRSLAALSSSAVSFGDAHYERFLLPLDYWSEARYISQWKEGLERVLRRKPSCLVTWMFDPKHTDYTRWWAMYPSGPVVIIEDQMMDPRELPHKFEEQRLYEYVENSDDLEEKGNDYRPRSGGVQKLLRAHRSRSG